MIKLLSLALTLIIVSSLLSENAAAEDEINNREVKYYDKINEHLKKKVDTDDVEANIAELKRWYNSPRRLMTIGSSLWPVVEQVLNMKTYTKCDMEAYRILQANNDGLMSDSRLSEDNYSLQRTDKLVHHYFTRFASVCYNAVPQYYDPSAGFGWKRIAYGKIEDYVEKHNDKRYDEDRTMSVIKEMLVRLERENKDGALTDAARQIVSMDSQVLGDDRCTYKAYEIMRSNENAVMKFSKQKEPQPDYLFFLIRDRLEKHCKLCQNVYPAMFQAKIKELDQKSLRSLVILASEYYITRAHYARGQQDITKGIGTEYAQINPDFTAPEVIELMSRRSSQHKDSDEIHFMITKDVKVADLLPLNLRVFATQSHPDYGYLYKKLPDSEYENIYKRRFYSELAGSEPKIEKMINEFIFEPCQKFRELMYDVLVPSMHNAFGAIFASPTDNDKVLDHLGFILGQTAWNLCEFALNQPYLERLNFVFEFKTNIENLDRSVRSR